MNRKRFLLYIPNVVHTTIVILSVHRVHPDIGVIEVDTTHPGVDTTLPNTVVVWRTYMELSFRSAPSVQRLELSASQQDRRHHGNTAILSLL